MKVLKIKMKTEVENETHLNSGWSCTGADLSSGAQVLHKCCTSDGAMSSWTVDGAP